MRLFDLITPDALDPILGAIDVKGLAADSRAIAPGFAFFAVPGHAGDGLAYVDDAKARGASVVIAQRSAPCDLPLVIVDDVRAALAHAAERFYPLQPSLIVAVTGTSGKTSVVSFLRQIWQALGYNAASLGTVGLVDSTGAHYGALTTPGPVELHQTLNALAQRGVTHLAMEASSLGIEQRRLDGVRLSAAAFTNFSRDHLDHHQDMESYFAAKMRLFDVLLTAGRPVVIDADSDVALRVAKIVEARGLVAFNVGVNGDAIRVREIKLGASATQVLVRFQDEDYAIDLPLAGAFQVSNALVAAGLAIVCGAEPQRVFATLSALQGAPGRLERVGEKDGAPIFVDYAHKPDALEKVLTTLRPLARNRLLIVFGCGGDRDQGKRALMGQIAAREADCVIVTDDNPRHENAQTIRAAVLAGAHAHEKGSAEIIEIADRRQAIIHAIAQMHSGDVLVIAGKGHETGQIIGDQTFPFSDHDVVSQVLRANAVTGPTALWSGLALISALGARVSGGLARDVTGVSIDTRSLQPGDLFFAIQGEARDGHDFVRAAFDRGAASAVIDERHAGALAGAGPVLIVKDVQQSLESLAQRARARTHHWGVPLTLARMPGHMDYGVFELGMNHAGEIAALVSQVRPHVAVITRVAPVHLENFSSIEAIAEAKAEIFSGLDGGVAIINRDDEVYDQLLRTAQDTAAHIFSFGETGVEARLISYRRIGDMSEVDAEILGKRLQYVIGAPGKHIALNSLSALLVAGVFDLDVERAAATLAGFVPPSGRGQRERISTINGDVTLIDESYNANPTSVRAALEQLATTQPGVEGRRIVVLGDMLELGPDALTLHRGLADDLIAAKVDQLFTAGQLMSSLYYAAPESMRGAHRRTAQELAEAVIATIRPGDVVMIKGSNGSRMSHIVAAIKQSFVPATAS
ncbi:MAG: UDP-N-acetylmuramoyl-L-alanyl-D-glutamate--2,6-diaminopimelate ligase [Alphaproteobacteria bacterium]|nr:UDP-N-acetylmuramoyl-L-alanyl-D-glutamate--2,6-diaminopimelate ligase [Alphaproteobacteria bacterium]